MSWVFVAICGGVVALLVRDEFRIREAADVLARRIHGSRCEHLPIDASEYPASVSGRLVGLHRALEESGFEAVGDFDVTERFLRTLGIHQFARLFVSADQRAYVALACIIRKSDDTTTVFEDFRLQFVSELQDGRFLYTLESDDQQRVLDPPELEHDLRAVGTDVTELWRHHQARLDHEVAVTVQDLDDLVASQRREADLRRAHRIAMAERGLTRGQMRALGGPENAVLARRVARQLRRRVGRPGEF